MAKKTGLYETMEFNSAAYAQDVVKEAEEKLEKTRIPYLVSAIVTVVSIVAYLLIESSKLQGVGGVLFLVAIIGALYSYIAGGGFGNAVHTAFKVATFGWFFFPFPTDLLVGITIMIFTVPAFFFMPVFFLRVQRKQLKKDLAEAQKYLNYCQTA